MKVPVAGVTVTIAAGPSRRREYRHGQKRSVTASRMLQKTNCTSAPKESTFELKEAIVHRSRPTILPDGSVPNYRGDPQKEPGQHSDRTGMAGREWRILLKEVLVVHDLLYIDVGTPPENKVTKVYRSVPQRDCPRIRQ